MSENFLARLEDAERRDEQTLEALSVEPARKPSTAEPPMISHQRSSPAALQSSSAALQSSPAALRSPLALRSPPAALRSENISQDKQRLASLRQKPLSVQLAEVLQEKNMRAIDWLRAFDTNCDGVISQEEFYEHITAYGLNGPREEADALFDSLDGDHSRTLTLDELKPGLHRMQQSSSEV